MSKGYVYVLSNESMPGLLKIGRTCRSVKLRSEELFQTGVPTPFIVDFEIATPDCIELERWVHSELVENRVSDSREFFRIEKQKAVQAIEGALHLQVSEFVEEYGSGHILVHELASISEATVFRAAEKCGLETYDMDWVFDALSQDALIEASISAAKTSPYFRKRIEQLIQSREEWVQ